MPGPRRGRPRHGTNESHLHADDRAAMIGIFGGTFDPIHFGHLRPALELMQTLQLDEVRFIPCHQPPHRDAPGASSDQRLRMVEAAVAGVAGFRVDRRELHRSGPSYMYDTLRSLRDELPGTRLCLLLGMDALLGFPGWHRWREILELAHLVGAHRPGWSPPVEGELAELLLSRGTADVSRLRQQAAGSIVLQPVTQLEISATAVRSMVAAGLSPRFLVPDAVCELMEQESIYRNH